MSTTLQDKQESLKELVLKNQDRLVEFVPKPERLAKSFLLAALREPKIYDCTPLSVLTALTTCAELGLEPGPVLGHMYLVPYWKSKISKYELQPIPGYRGLMTLARRSINVRSFSAHVIRANDRFQVSYGIHEELIHEPSLEPHAGVPMGAYAVAFPGDDGRPQFEVMTRGQIEEVMGRSKSRDQQGRLVGPWVTDTDEMWRKTAVRRLCKYLEMSPLLVRAFEVEDDAEGVYETEKGEVEEEILNPPQREEAPAIVNLDALVPVAVTEPEPPPAPVQQAPAVAPKPKLHPPARLNAPPLKPRTLKVVLSMNPFGISREMLEEFIGVLAENWNPTMIEGLETRAAQLSMGTPREEVFPAMFGLEAAA